MSKDAVTVSGLTVQYGSFTAVDNLSFSVSQGEIFGMIGPNGAGKTTTLECIEGLRPIKHGRIAVFGTDAGDRRRLYTDMGVQLQETKFQDTILVKELISLYASFYPVPADMDTLLAYFELMDKKDALVKKLSGGQKQKLAIILALIGNPKILVLDEISTGLDPQARVLMWKKLKELNKKGITILLTTHFMEEAEELCSRVCLLVKGRIKAIGTLSELIQQADLEIQITAYAEPAEIRRLQLDQTIKGLKMEAAGGKAVLSFPDASQISRVMSFLCGQIQIKDLDLYKPKLEDVFLKLTGTSLT